MHLLQTGLVLLGGAVALTACGPAPDERLVAPFAEQSVAHFDWLVGHGVPFKHSFWDRPAWTPPTDDGLMWLGENSHPFSELARPAPRGHRPHGTGRTGGVLMDALSRAMRVAGVEVRFNSRAQQLVTAAAGELAGVMGRPGGMVLGCPDNSRLILDSAAQAETECGELLLARSEGAVAADHAGTQLQDVIAGHAPGRRAATDITLFKSLGIAAQDLAVGQAALASARALGLGTEVDL